MTKIPAMTLRPYQLIYAVCALDEQGTLPANPAIRSLLDSVRKEPDLPITLQCNVGEVFSYQDPGTKEDTPEGSEFNVRRDLEILHKLNLAPGCTLPARIIFNRLFDFIETLDGICVYNTTTSDAWRGNTRAVADAYARGRAKGISALLPVRSEPDMKQSKTESIAAMHKADAIDVRPHILVCSVCQYGNGTRPPFAEDNLPELLALILEKPGVRIRLAPHADWMMCAPCPYRESSLNACVNNKGTGGLPNQLRDLRVLQILGQRFGDVVDARELYRRLLERIPGTLALCRLEPARPSVWWSGCGSATADSPAYFRGREQLMARLG
ncbi:MAG: hypothetical protein A2269_00620 [Lentisphaerae bacterium RIFOXYA12_FULL_60_10]|nr:MAG: hypothetical protein A2269_00620 [Lentisphaerae bacterium RIFOXYA12_FULL_60_10]